MKRSDLAGWWGLAMALFVLNCKSADPGTTGDDAGPAAADGGEALDGSVLDGNLPPDGGLNSDGGTGADARGDADIGGADGDGSTADGGVLDSGGGDGGEVDSGPADGGPADGGPADGGPADGGPADGGAGDGGPTIVALTVLTAADVHPISPLIYGINWGKTTCSTATGEFGVSLCRLGGNPWSTYNWENNASNAEVIQRDQQGNEIARCYPNSDQLGTSNEPAHTVTSVIAEAAANSAATVVTIPIIDYVAADKLGTGCPGDVVLSGADYLTTRFKQNQARKNAPLPDPSQAPDVDDGIVSQDEFVQFVKHRVGSSRVLFTLDNQPELWSLTQVRVHPAHPTYEEVVSRDVTYAAMLRDNWPDAEITGYGGYGYWAFLTLQNAPNPPGNMVFLDYYLGSMSQASANAGRRLIDYLDIHWYSDVTAGGKSILVDDETEAMAQARVQAPRSLWDSSYTEASWIGNNYGPIRLIPWIQAKIDTFYPEIKLAISAWSYGGEGTISGAIAVADALGTFGREGVGLAALDPSGSDVSCALGAFAMFRNYDGAGAAFGDTSVRATTSDVERVSVYASADSGAAGRVVIVAINRSPEALETHLSVEGGAFANADLYRLTSAACSPRQVDSLTATESNRFVAVLPPYSITVIVPKN